MGTALLEFLLPEPVSPSFRQGGVLQGFNEDLALTLAAFIFLFLADHALVKPFLRSKSRWFAIHVIGNALVSVASFPELVKTLSDPLNAFVGPMATMVPNSTVSAIHLYHVIFFKLRPDEKFHHLTSLPVTLLVVVPFKQYTGAMSSFGAFFLCGLPGGLNYLMLVLEKEGLMTRLQQKQYDAHINTWMRGPSMAIYAFMIYQAWVYDRYIHAPLPAYSQEAGFFLAPSSIGSAAFLSFVALLHFWNGQYYTMMSVGNFYSTQTKMSLSADDERDEVARKRQ